MRGAPHDLKGEYRYACEDCAAGAGGAARFVVCERCWDAMQAGEWVHAGGGHTFSARAPSDRRHNTAAWDGAEDVWAGAYAGGPGGAASAARARERLRERAGL